MNLQRQIINQKDQFASAKTKLLNIVSPRENLLIALLDKNIPFFKKIRLAIDSLESKDLKSYLELLYPKKDFNFDDKEALKKELSELLNIESKRFNKLSFKEAFEELKNNKSPQIYHEYENSSLIVYGQKINLTSAENTIFKIIFSSGDRFVSYEQISGGNSSEASCQIVKRLHEKIRSCCKNLPKNFKLLKSKRNQGYCLLEN